MMDPDQQLRNLKDFLLVYNRMTEICFNRCTSNFNYRNLTMDEDRCVDSCAGKLIRSNHRLMNTYVQLMPKMVQRRMEEMESKAAAAAAASASVGPPAAEPQTAVPSSPPLEGPPLTDSSPEALKPAGWDVGLDAAVPAPTAAAEVQVSAAAALTPVAEAVNLSLFNEAGNGPFHPAGLAQMPPIESESSASVFTPPQPASVSVDVPVTPAAAPAKSLHLSGQERAAEAPRHQDSDGPTH